VTRTLTWQSRWRITLSLLLTVLVLGVVPLWGVVAHSASNHQWPGAFAVSWRGRFYHLLRSGVQPPPTDQQCRQQFGIPCYSPQEMQNAYDLTPVLNAGFTGKGQTIVIIDSFGSPTIKDDLHAFDQGYGLPDPPLFKVLAPLGTINFNSSNADMVGWAFESTLDVEWAHAMAPDANIILMTSPVDETEGVQGLPEFLYLERLAVKSHLANIISQSWGATENTLFTFGGRQLLKSFNDFYRQAAAAHVTVFASAGDAGVANVNINGQIYPFPTVNFPASSPYVTAVGGTTLMADTSGNYQSEVVWNDGPGSATGGGVSQFFAEPAYELGLPSSDQQILNGFRGLPDIAYNADPNTAILVYASFLGGNQVGWYFIGGTSEGSPQWSGIIADGNQMAGHPLGFLNPMLYQIGEGANYAQDFHDITQGNNSQGSIQGYNATPGWDPCTGWGSPQAANLLQDLIKLSR
jgi:subtilase family serine protease